MTAGSKKLKKSGDGCFVYCQYYLCIDCRNVYSAGYQCGKLMDLRFHRRNDGFLKNGFAVSDSRTGGTWKLDYSLVKRHLTDYSFW